MKDTVLLAVASLLSVLFFTLHLSDDIVRGIEPGTLKTLNAVLTGAVWLYGALVLAGRRSGYIITLLGSLLGFAMPLSHMMGKGVGVASNIGKSAGAFFFAWTLIAIGVTALFSIALSVRGLWRLPWRRSG